MDPSASFLREIGEIWGPAGILVAVLVLAVWKLWSERAADKNVILSLMREVITMGHNFTATLQSNTEIIKGLRDDLRQRDR